MVVVVARSSGGCANVGSARGVWEAGGGGDDLTVSNGVPAVVFGIEPGVAVVWLFGVAEDASGVEGEGMEAIRAGDGLDGGGAGEVDVGVVMATADGFIEAGVGAGVVDDGDGHGRLWMRSR